MLNAAVDHNPSNATISPGLVFKGGKPERRWKRGIARYLVATVALTMRWASLERLWKNSRPHRLLFCEMINGAAYNLRLS